MALRFPVAPIVVGLTDGASVAVNAAEGNVFELTLGASGHTIANPTNPQNEQMILFRITQGGAGSNTVNWDTAYQFTADIPAPTLSTTVGKKDYIGFIYDTTSSKWNCLATALGYA